MLIPNKHNGYFGGVRRLCMPDDGGDGGGGGGSSNTTSTSTQTTELPEWARGYAKNVLAKGAALTDINQNPYQTYGANRIAGFSPMQQRAQQGAANMQTSGQLGTATDLASAAGIGALGTNYQAGQFSNQFTPPTQFSASTIKAPGLKNYQMTGPANVMSEKFGQQAATDYMSPYMQSVVGIQQREAQRQADIAGTQRNAQATQAGAFGGSRQAIMDAEAARNLATQKGDIQAQGLQSAYGQAQQQFNADQAQRMQAALANQGMGYNVGSQNLQAKLGVQQFGAGQNLQAQQANEQSRQFGAGQGLQAASLGAQYGQSAQQLGEQSRQYGAGLGMQGLQTGLQAAGQLGQLGGQQFQQGMDINKLQSAYGGQQQQQTQRYLDQDYQDFQNQQNYPYKQLGFMSDLVNKMPLGQQSSKSMYEPPGSMLGQAAGLGMGALGFSSLYNSATRGADGGMVHDYAGGGVTSQANKDSIIENMYSMEGLQKAKEAALARRDIDTVNAIDERIAQLNAIQAQSASINRGLGNAFNQIPEERQEEMMAGGGIVAFADEGAVDLEKIQREKDRAALGQAYEDFKKGARKTGAAAMDMGTLPFRAIAGIGESVITRPLRALGVDIPYLPESYYGGDYASMTPYFDKLRKEEGYTTGLMDPFNSSEKKSSITNKPQPKGAGARSTPSFIAKDAPEEKPASKQKKLSPAINKAVTEMAEKQGVPKDEFMDAFNQMRDKLQAESKEDLKGLQDLIDKQSGKSKEIKDQALGKALAEFGFNMAAQASKRGREGYGQGFAGLLGSASAASPILAASAAESQKLAAAADENDMKLQMELRKFNIATRKNDSATAMQHATNMRQLQQSQETIQLQQAQLAETIRNHKITEGLTGARINASGNAYSTAIMRTKSNIAINAQKQAAKDWADPFKGRELKQQYPSQKAYAGSLYNDMWSQAMPQLELIGTKSAEE